MFLLVPGDPLNDPTRTGNESRCARRRSNTLRRGQRDGGWRRCAPQANASEQLDPPDDDRGTADHRVERLEGLLLPEPRDPLDQEFEIGLDSPLCLVNNLKLNLSLVLSRAAFPSSRSISA